MLMEEVKNITEDNSVLYEMSFIQEPEEESVPKESIEKFSGKILEDRPLMKIRFAYPIKKQTQGFLGFIKFAAEPERIVSINADLNLEKRVLRCMISRFSEKNEEEGSLDGIQDGRVRRGRFVRGEKKTTGYEPPLSNEALEKKIEEILQ